MSPFSPATGRIVYLYNIYTILPVAGLKKRHILIVNGKFFLYLVEGEGEGEYIFRHFLGGGGQESNFDSKKGLK